MNHEAYPDALPAKYRLHWYVLERVLGQGGFGITYLAQDTNLDLQVAIKEYLPSDVAQRRSDATVRPRTQALGERYRWGLTRFIEEARTLAKFDHPNIVRVHSVFEANDTAYMVMRFEQGENLATLLDRRGTLGQDELLRTLLPILDGLERVHAAGFIHRDIKPENIHIRRDGSPVLLDFGSARLALGGSRAMTVLVAPGYAPLEQYYGEADTQGPWTDIYGLAATAYRAIAGVAPQDAVLRAKSRLGSTTDTMVPAATLGAGTHAAHVLAAIDHGLQLAEAERPQSLAQWRRELLGEDRSAPPPAASPATAAPAPPLPGPPSEPPFAGPVGGATVRPRGEVPPSVPGRSSGTLIAMTAGAVGAAGVLAIGAAMLWPRTAPPPPVVSASGPAPSVAAAAEPRAAEPATPEPRRDAEDRAAAPVGAASPATAAPAPARTTAPERPPLPAPLRPDARRATATAAPPPASAPAAPARVAPGVTENSAAPAPWRPPASLAASSAAPAPVSKDAGAPASAPVLLALARPAASAPPPDRLTAADDAYRRGDYTAAYGLVRPLANGGVARAQELLGRMAEEGHGLPPNALQAYIWYSLAAQRGQASAKGAQERMARRLQQAEIAQADRLVQSWQPR